MLDHMVNNCLFSCHGNMSQLLLQLVVAVHLCMALPILYRLFVLCFLMKTCPGLYWAFENIIDWLATDSLLD